MSVVDRDKCVVRGCPNRTGEGGFVGNVCVPCYEMITTGVVGRGETFVHKMLEEIGDLRRELDRVTRAAL